MAIFVIQSDLAYGMYRLTQGLTRRPTLSFARYKPMLKRLTVASGGLASLGGASYGLQMYNQKERKDCEGQIRKESEEWFLNRLSEADSFTWWDFIQSNVIGKRSDKIVSLPHDVVEEARMICDQLIPDMPVIGFCKYISSGCALGPISYKIDSTVRISIPYFYEKEIVKTNELNLARIYINQGWWKNASMEEKKAVLAHEYGHWVYRRKHGFNMPSSKKEEEFADRVSVEVTGSAKGLVDFLQKYQRKRNNRVLMGVGGLELLSLTYRMILGDRELLNGLCSSILRGGISVALLIDNATEIPPTIDTQSSEEMEEMIEKLRSQDNNWFNSGALSNKDVHPILPLRIALAIQHEKRLKEQEIKLCEQHKREQAEFDEVILPALTGA